MNKLESMTVFVRVVEKGSFSAVADELRISGTMVGLHIKALEKHLGTRLLNRTTRRQSLTDFGLGYYQRCRQILSDIEDAESVALTLHQEPRGRLKVACPVSLGVHSLTPLIAQFLQSWPDVTIDLVLSDKGFDMVEEGIDIMIRIGDLDSVNSLVARTLPAYRSVVCASPGYLENAGTPLHIDELAHHRCLGFSHPRAGSEWSFLHENQRIKVPVNMIMSVNNGEALRIAALNGLGIIMQPEVLLMQDLREGKLVPLFSEYDLFSKPVHILTFSDRQQLPKIRLFVDFLMQHFRETLAPLECRNWQA